MSASCGSCPKDEARRNIQLLRLGQRTTCPELYALPEGAEEVHKEFLGNLKSGDWSFVLVRGDNGAGKSVYIKYLEHHANSYGYAISHIEIDPEQIKLYGAPKYFSLQMFNTIRLPNGEIMAYKILKDEGFRDKVHRIVEKNLADFEFYSPAFAQVLLMATDSSSENKALRAMAISWLKGEPKYVTELREMGVFDKTMKSILDVPTNKLLYSMKDLIQHLGHKGLLVSIDEIEKAGELPVIKGRETLSTIRDLINILTSEDSLPLKRGTMKGLFIAYAISTFYLGYSGVIEVGGVDFKAAADKYGAPKVTIQEMPRLSTMLRDSGAMVSADFSSMSDLKAIAGKIIPCYSYVNSRKMKMEADELAKKAFEMTNDFLARRNVMAMVRTLDSL
jgi:hypothetical protein